MTLRTKIAALALGMVALGALGCQGHQRVQVEERPEKAYKYVTFRVDDALDDLEATDAQRERVHVVKDRLFDEAMAMRAKAKGSRQAALTELRRDEPDAEKLHVLVDARMDDVRALMHKAVDGILEVHGVLTPEQRAEIAIEIEDRMNSHDR